MTTQDMVAFGFCSFLAAILGSAVVYSAVSAWRKRKYGCKRCAYRRFMRVNGCLTRYCTASCGNQYGDVCGAWSYRSPDKEDL